MKYYLFLSRLKLALIDPGGRELRVSEMKENCLLGKFKIRSIWLKRKKEEAVLIPIGKALYVPNRQRIWKQQKARLCS